MSCSWRPTPARLHACAAAVWLRKTAVQQLTTTSLIVAVAAANPAAAESTRVWALDPDASRGLVAVALNQLSGDNFFDAARVRRNQALTLSEQRLELAALTPILRGVYIGMTLPLVHRSLDLSAAGSQDANAFGLGDVILAGGWRTPQPLASTWTLAVEGQWKTPSGNPNLALDNLGSASRSTAPLGTGGHDLDLWSVARWDHSSRRGGLGLGLGYRLRTDLNATYSIDGALALPTDPRERLLVTLHAHTPVFRPIVLSGGIESFKEVLLFDSRRKTLGQNDVWALSGWLGVFAYGGDWRAGLRWDAPVIGKGYPGTPPDQYAEREPLLGHRIGGEVAWFLPERKP